MSFFKEYLDYLKANSKWWITPTILLLLLLGGLIFFAEGSVLAPFIYSLF